MYSQKYIEELRVVHADKSRTKGFGGKTKNLGKFHKYVEMWQPRSLLDYGCGKGGILSDLQSRYRHINCAGYDPAVDMFNNTPTPVECVFSNDVLEHIEPEYLNQVLCHINELSTLCVWLRIDTVPARKRLRDGRNAHLILEDQTWWTKQISRYIDGIIVYNNLNNKGKLDIAIQKRQNDSRRSTDI